MISKGKRQYLIGLYVVPFLRYCQTVTGKHRGCLNMSVAVHKDVETIVKEVATKGYYDGVKKLNHDLDLDVFHTIITVNPTAQFLTIHRNRERNINDFKQEAT